MAKGKLPKMTAEELAQRAETDRMLEERIAYHQAKAVELGEISSEDADRYLAARAAAAAAALSSSKMTPEERALRKANQRMLEERIAYHSARAREEDDRRTQAAD